jgi:short-subunit dehydrogenase
VTGGVQGLGRLIAQKMALRSPVNSLNIIVVDIREDLFKDMEQDFKNISAKLSFYKCNLAEAKEIDALWLKVTQEHGPIHILINNAAICRGKHFSELSVDQFRMTMDINFMAYVHLTKLFMTQANLTSNFHMVNISSIGGHMTCQRNTDYSASKYALSGFLESLRMELEVQ